MESLLENTREPEFMAQAAAALASSIDGLNARQFVWWEFRDGGSRLRVRVDWGGRKRLIEIAADKGWLRAMAWLVESGADVGPAIGGVPLFYAVRRERVQAAEFLLRRGADDVANLNRLYEGRTVLHIAAMTDSLHLTRALLHHGADMEVRDEDGRTALERALFYLNHEEREYYGRLSDSDYDWDAPPVYDYIGPCTNEMTDLLTSVRDCGCWQAYVDAPREELLALQRELLSLRERGRATLSSSVHLHERLFVEVPYDIFKRTIAFWRNDRDY